MNKLLMFAGFLSVVIGCVHSVLGEILLFNKLRNGALVPTSSAPPLNKGNVRILWASWHLASIFGFAIGAILVQLAIKASAPVLIAQAIASAMCFGSVLVCYATKARHPGWVGLLVIAILCWFA